MRFLRQWLYSLSPHCLSAVPFKAETRAAEALGPYGADGLTHSPLNPPDWTLAPRLTVSPY